MVIYIVKIILIFTMMILQLIISLAKIPDTAIFKTLEEYPKSILKIYISDENGKSYFELYDEIISEIDRLLFELTRYIM